MTDYLDPVPEDRTIVPGIWSDFMDRQLASKNSNPYFYSFNSVQVGLFDNAILQGNAISVSKELNLAANSVISIKLVKNVESVITYATANGLFVSYVDGDVSGNLFAVSSGARLNTLATPNNESSFEFYDGAATGTLAATEKDRINLIFVINGLGVIQLENKTAEPISTIFSCGVAALSEPVLPYMLTVDTLLEPTTEMSIYNGTN